MQDADDNLGFNHSRHLTSWMLEHNVNVVVSCYRKHKLFCMGVQGSGEVSTYFVNMRRPMGMCATPDGETIYASELGNIYTFVGKNDEIHDEWGYFDRSYYPQKINICGDNDIHDLRLGTDDDGKSKLYYVSALFNCICIPSDEKSFDVHWVPPWITKNADGLPPCEDRCHLNGMALVDGKPRFVTSSSIADYYGAWKEHHGEGVVYDIKEETIVCSGLWAPHSPNWYNGKLWIGEAGTGQFGYVDLQKRKFVPMKFIPGFIRGITFYKHYALINTSMDRHDFAFRDLPLGDIMREKGAKPHAGVFIIDMKTMDLKHTFEFLDPKTELYDVIVIPNVRRMRIVGLNELSTEMFHL